MAIRVRAIRAGYYKGRRREGSEFDVESKGDIGTWMEEIQPAGKDAAKGHGSPAAGARSAGKKNEPDTI